MDRVNMADIKCGDLFWECDSSGNCQMEAMADAYTDGDIVTLQARIVATNAPQALMMRLSAPQYAPSLYRSPQYLGVP